MKLCIPIASKEGLIAKISDHFGSAPYFLIYDTNKATFKIIENSNQHHAHGQCQPLGAILGQDINAVVCSGMGIRAINKLNEGGIKTYKAKAETVKDIIRKFQDGALEKITIKNACVEHHCHESKRE